jgi:hypothetical protein
MTKLRFAQIIETREGNPYLLVSREQAKQLHVDWHKPMPVIIQINGKPDVPWHINMMPAGDGSFYLYLSGDVRKASQTKVGDLVTADVEFDTTYRNGPLHPMPYWFDRVLETTPRAKTNWDNLTPSRQKEVLRYFSWLKSDEAKDRNLKKVIAVLSGEPGRFMARDWKDGK